MTNKQPEVLALAAKFHMLYEHLAPSFGYETSAETKRFDPESANGKLMQAVCAELLSQPPLQGGVPAGFVLVPVEPSAEILQAMILFYKQGSYLNHPKVPYQGTANGDSPEAWEDRMRRAFYANMLAAAPQTPIADQGEPEAWITRHDSGDMLWHDLREAEAYSDEESPPEPLYAAIQQSAQVAKG